MTGCVQYIRYTPDPLKDIKQWVANFKQQKSFVYEYEMKTAITRVKAKGTCIIGRAEHIKGRWNSMDSVINYEYIGLGDIEYAKKDGQWEKYARGEESNVFAQIVRMLDFDKFEYLVDDTGSYNYHFKANVPFLAPDKWKQMIGTLKISKPTYLPEFIWAGLPDSSVYWKVKISDYNKQKDIASPIRDWNDFIIKSDRVPSIKELIKPLKKRLKTLSIDFRVTKEDSVLILSSPSQYNKGDIEDMLSTNEVNIYSLTDTREQAIRIGYLQNDPKHQLFMADKIADLGSIKNASVQLDYLQRPYLLIALRKKAVVPQNLCLEVDGVVITTITLDKPRKMSKITFYISDMGYYQMNLLKSSLTQPLPVIQVEEISKGTD